MAGPGQAITGPGPGAGSTCSQSSGIGGRGESLHPGLPAPAHGALCPAASPNILNLSLLEGSGPARAFCMAEGNPLPNITWWGPGNTSESPTLRETQVNFQSAAEITLRRNGTYTCRAKNTRGCAELSLTVGPSKNTRFLLLAALLPAALLLLALLVLALVLCQRRKGRGAGGAKLGE